MFRQFVEALMEQWGGEWSDDWNRSAGDTRSIMSRKLKKTKAKSWSQCVPARARVCVCVRIREFVFV